MWKARYVWAIVDTVLMATLTLLLYYTNHCSSPSLKAFSLMYICQWCLWLCSFCCISQGKIVVGHTIESDFSAINYKHPAAQTRDIKTFKRLRDMYLKKTGLSGPGLKCIGLAKLSGVLLSEYRPTTCDSAMTTCIILLLPAQMQLCGTKVNWTNGKRQHWLYNNVSPKYYWSHCSFCTSGDGWYIINDVIMYCTY